jgi:hypothetical protein
MKDGERANMIRLAMLYAAAAALAEPGAPALPRFPEPRPENYYVHLTKAQRRGKTPEQLRELRKQMAAVGGPESLIERGPDEEVAPKGSLEARGPESVPARTEEGTCSER